jgi:hypothetical protein
MLVWLFILFFSLGILFTIIGFFADIPLFSMTGTIFIFLLGLNLLNEPLTYSVGENSVIEYGSNLTNVWSENGGEIPTTTDVYMFSTNTTQIYEQYDDASTNRFGILLIGLGALAFCLSLFML